MHSVSPHASKNQHALPFPPHMLRTQMPKLFSQLPTSASQEPQLAGPKPAPDSPLPPPFLESSSCNTCRHGLIKARSCILAQTVEVVNAPLLTNGLYSAARTSLTTCSEIRYSLPCHPTSRVSFHSSTHPRLIHPSLLLLLALLSGALFVLFSLSPLIRLFI